MRTSGKVLKDFESLRKALFNEEISHLAFMRDGKPEILYTQKYVDKLEQETERLNNELKNLEKLNNANYESFIEANNIINELEKWAEGYIFADIFKDKIKELKGEGNEKN